VGYVPKYFAVSDALSSRSSEKAYAAISRLSNNLENDTASSVMIGDGQIFLCYEVRALTSGNTDRMAWHRSQSCLPSPVGAMHISKDDGSNVVEGYTMSKVWEIDLSVIAEGQKDMEFPLKKVLLIPTLNCAISFINLSNVEDTASLNQAYNYDSINVHDICPSLAALDRSGKVWIIRPSAHSESAESILLSSGPHTDIIHWQSVKSPDFYDNLRDSSTNSDDEFFKVNYDMRCVPNFHQQLGLLYLISKRTEKANQTSMLWVPSTFMKMQSSADSDEKTNELRSLEHAFYLSIQFSSVPRSHQSLHVNDSGNLVVTRSLCNIRSRKRNANEDDKVKEVAEPFTSEIPVLAEVALNLMRKVLDYMWRRIQRSNLDEACDVTTISFSDGNLLMALCHDAILQLLLCVSAQPKSYEHFSTFFELELKSVIYNMCDRKNNKSASSLLSKVASELRLVLSYLFFDKLLFFEVISRLGRKLEPEVVIRLFPLPILDLTLNAITNRKNRNFDQAMKYEQNFIVTLSALDLFEISLYSGWLHYAQRFLTLACDDVGGTETFVTTKRCMALVLELMYKCIQQGAFDVLMDCLGFVGRLESVLQCFQQIKLPDSAYSLKLQKKSPIILNNTRRQCYGTTSISKDFPLTIFSFDLQIIRFRKMK
jgi:hypothetical protein